MQELRFVLIVVGALAIAALLFHGLWTSKKDAKAKFGHKPIGKIDEEQNDTATERAFAPEDDFEIIRKPSSRSFDNDESLKADPLLGDTESLEIDSPVIESPKAQPEIRNSNDLDDDLDIPSFNAVDTDVESPELETVTTASLVESEQIVESDQVIEKEADNQDDDMQVIVLNVHCNGKEPFVGTDLFESMSQNGLKYGDMDIFHRHSDLSGNGKVIFSVANMMQPGTLKHDDPATFTTKGISFFMTLPGFGDPEQNFKLMLKTAQQIADDMGGNVLDDRRNLMTPNRLDAYREQIQLYKAEQIA